MYNFLYISGHLSTTFNSDYLNNLSFPWLAFVKRLCLPALEYVTFFSVIVSE